MVEPVNYPTLTADTWKPRSMSLAGRMMRALVAVLPDLSTVVLVRRRTGGGDPALTLVRVHRALDQSVRGGSAGRRWLSSDVDVRLDHVESTPVRPHPRDPGTSGRADAPGRTAATRGAVAERPWARRLVVTNPGAPQGNAVFVLHRQPVDVATEGRHPVVLLAGRISHADQARMLAIPDVEHCLPCLTLTEDGRVVVDRSAVGADDEGRTADDVPGTSRRRDGRAARPGVCDTLTADALDAILAQICRDPRVATLLHDWVSDSVRR